MTSPSNGTLAELYEAYMSCSDEQMLTTAALNAANAALQATPEWAAREAANFADARAAAATEEALAAVKLAVGTEFLATGDKQPHPYAGVLRIDRRPVYDPRLALRWVKERPDYAHLVVPEAVDRRGFEKLARALADAGCPPVLANGPIAEEFVEWAKQPIVSVRIRSDD